MEFYQICGQTRMFFGHSDAKKSIRKVCKVTESLLVTNYNMYRNELCCDGYQFDIFFGISVKRRLLPNLMTILKLVLCNFFAFLRHLIVNRFYFVIILIFLIFFLISFN